MAGVYSCFLLADVLTSSRGHWQVPPNMSTAADEGFETLSAGRIGLIASVWI